MKGRPKFFRGPMARIREKSLKKRGEYGTIGIETKGRRSALEHKTKVAEDLELTEAQARYDAACKRLLSHKVFLAWILKSCLDEYKDSDIETIESYIEDTPQVGEVPVGEDATNRARLAGETVAGRSTEHATLTEGSVTYDIRFYAQAPRDGTLMEIIVNVEAQNKYNPGYPLIKRGIYYVSRMISAQNGVDFKNGEYGKLKKVCSIWICLNAPKERRNSITRYTLREEQLVGNSVEAAKNYDLISVVMICLGDAQERQADVLRMLDVLLSSECRAEEKKQILEEEFAIQMSERVEEEVAQMCNLSQGIVERGIAQGMAQGIEKGIAQGMERGIAQGVEKGAFNATLASLRRLIANAGMSAEQAMNVLEIPAAERPRYLAAMN